MNNNQKNKLNFRSIVMSQNNKFSKIHTQIYRDCNNHSTVVCFEQNITLKISKLLEIANEKFAFNTLDKIEEELKNLGIGSLASLPANDWNIQGIDAEILEPNFNNWKKGKVRMRVVLEFCPDEPEEKKEINNHKIEDDFLDDIRATISQQ